MRKITACFFLFFVFMSAKAEVSFVTYFDFNERCKAAYKNIYEMKLQAAAALIDAERKEHPDNLIPEYLNHYILFLKSFIGEEESDFAKLKTNFDRVNNIYSKLPDVSPYRNYFLAEMNLMTAFNKIKFKEFVGAALQVRKAFLLLELNRNKYPNYDLNKKSMGLLHAYIGAVPENYLWLVRLAGMSGDIKLGLRELEEIYKSTASSSSEFDFMHREIGFIFLFSRQHLQPDMERSLQFLQTMNVTDNPLEIFFECNLYYTAGRSDIVKGILFDYKIASNTYPINYLYFVKGLAELSGFEEDAFSNFNYYVKLSKGKSFIKAAYQKMAWIKLVQGDTLAYRNLMQTLISKGDLFTDEDKQAQKEAADKILPNTFLLKARVLFDCGNYKEALNLLADKGNLNSTEPKDNLEYIYRLARVYEKLRMRDLAIENYKLTIKNGKTYKYYYAAGSAVFLGQMFEKENNLGEAEKYYRMALQMKDHEYQNSLDQKARAGLNRIGR